jgi:hypothetical protein
MRHHDTLPPAWLALREVSRVTPTDEDLRRFITHNFPRLIPHLTHLDQSRDWATAIYEQYMQQFHVDDFPAHTKLSRIRSELAGHLKGLLGASYCPPTKEDVAFRAVAIYMRQKLGVPQGQSWRDGSQWDVPQCHAALRRPEVQREILGAARQWLMRHGYCPDLAAAFDVGPVSTNTMEPGDDTIPNSPTV